MNEIKDLSENISSKLPSNMMLAGIVLFVAGALGLMSGNNGMLVLFMLGIALIAKAAKKNSNTIEGDES